MQEAERPHLSVEVEDIDDAPFIVCLLNVAGKSIRIDNTYYELSELPNDEYKASIEEWGKIATALQIELRISDEIKNWVSQGD